MPEGTVPNNFAEVMASDQRGWRLTPVYFLQLEDDSIGYFWASFAKTGEVVVTTDRLLLEQVWTLLQSQAAKTVSAIMYVNDGLGLFVALPAGSRPLEDYETKRFLTQNWLLDICIDDGFPFIWGSGLSGHILTMEKLLLSLAASLEEHHPR